MAGPRDPDEIEDPDLDQGTDEGTDARQIDDEGGDDAQAGQELEESQAEERVDRRSRRDDVLREELRAEREHRARVEAELNIIRQEREQRQQPQGETEEQFQQRIALLDPESRMDAKLDRANRKHQQQLALATFAAADRADKAAFDSKAVSDPVYRKYAQEVEQVLAIERRKGRDFDRETILDFVRGRALKNRQAQKPTGQPARREQQTRTTGGRGDVGREQPRQRRYAPGDMSPEAVRQRLESDDAYI